VTATSAAIDRSSNRNSVAISRTINVRAAIATNRANPGCSRPSNKHAADEMTVAAAIAGVAIVHAMTRRRSI
jgi:hypothetical protein